MKKTKTGYMCGIAFLDELESTDATVYPNLKTINKMHDFEECGVVLVEIKFKRWVKRPNQAGGRK